MIYQVNFPPTQKFQMLIYLIFYEIATLKTPADVYISFACYTTLQAAVQATPQIFNDKFNFVYPPK